MPKTICACLFVLGLLLALAPAARADATITIDGDLGDWPADAFSFLDHSSDLSFPWRDIEQVWATDDNSSGSDGMLYLALEFRSDFRLRVLGVDIDVFIYLDTDGDGVADLEIEATEREVRDGDGNLLGSIDDMAFDGPYMEISVPYAVLGLSHGSDSFGLAFETNGWPGIRDYSPEPGEGEGGFIVYDGTTGDGVEPLAVLLLAQAARAEPAGVRIGWSTGSERGNAGFRVWRQGPGEAWKPVREALLPGLGDAPLGRRYELVDPDGRAGDRYRIEDVDRRGRSRFHPVITASARAVLPRGPRCAGSTARHAMRSVRVDGTVRDTGLASISADPGVDGRPGRASLRRTGSPGRKALLQPVSESGAVTKWAVRDAGLVSIPALPKAVRLERAGEPVPVLPGADRLVFVGLPDRDRHADYEIVLGRPGRAEPMTRRPVRGACAQPVTTAVTRLEIEPQSVYCVAAPGPDPFFWAWAAPGVPAELELDVPAPARAAAGLSLRLFGLASSHRIRLALGGQALGVLDWYASGLVELELELPEGLLADGANALELAVESAEPWDMVFVDAVTLAYPRRLELGSGPLRFEASAGQCIELGGSSAADLWLLDVTDPRAPVLLDLDKAGVGGLRFQDTQARGLRRYLVVGRAAALARAERLGVRVESALAERRDGADALIVTHPSLAPAARRLAELHAARGLLSLVVGCDEVYDTFGDGRPTPAAIRKLVRAAAQWNPAPRFLLLFGSGSVDPQGYLGSTEPELVPVPFDRSAVYGYEFASDDWYVREGAERLMAVGRLPARDLEEAESLVERLSGSQAPLCRVAFLADRSDPAADGEAERFERAAGKLATACVPRAIEPVQIHKSDPDAHARLQAELETGVDALVYLGHGYMSGWSSGPVLVDAAGLDEFPSLEPFLLLSWTCFDGAFAGPWGESLAAAWLRSPGGALAATASTTLSDPDALELLAEQTLCRLGSAETLGEALLEAKRALAGLPESPALDDLLRAYTLLGDPTSPNPWKR
ncbi:MAG: hypothetical protein JXR96_07960 [Deltaproteobacteria bacterium]|nr:hypothetical protein [Deltaproteobacteria bacterium]